jgi:peptidoglycan hydrolase-like protein with peptidoglycan-binding domain
VTAIIRPFGLLSCALVLSLLGGGRLMAAESYPFEMRLSNNVLGDSVFKGEITPTNGRFEQVVTSGSLRVRLSGSITDDRVSVTGELLFSGNWRFFPFSTNGAFSSSGTFTGSVVAQRSNGQPARGSISIARPVAVAEVPKPVVQTAELADPKGDSVPVTQGQTQTQAEAHATSQQQIAVVAPPEPQEPALTHDQRAVVQQQLSVLGLYGSAIDGNFGLGTRKAIRALQRVSKLEATGYLTDATIAQLAKRSSAREQQIAAEQLVATQQAAELQAAAEQKAAEERAAQQAAAEQEAAEERAAQQVAAGQKAAEERAAQQAATERKVVEERTQLATAPAVPAIPAELANLPYGRYHALVIGNNAYRSLPKLKTAAGDAEAVAALLEKEYGYDVTLLTDASEEAIVGAFAALRQSLTPADNLLVYYAGHGWYDVDAERGYWLPVDAVTDNQSHWISNAEVTDMLKAIKAKQVLVVADSCYSGTLTRGLVIGGRGPGYIQAIVDQRARTAMTSGGLEPVADSGGDGHSVFAKAFLDTLRGNPGVIDGEGVFEKVRERVQLNAEQTPEYGNIRLAGHDGGDFLFVRKQ